jgi:hypothetical protein
MSNIAKWLSVFTATSWSYPKPDSSISILASGATIWFQWYAGNSVLNMIKISNWWKDSLDTSTYYTYSTNAAQNKFQILWFLEDWSSSALSLIPFKWNEANADPSSYSGRYVITKWDQLWIMLQSWSLVPAQIANVSVDVVLSTSSYVAQFTNKSSLSWTWWTLKKVESVIRLANSPVWIQTNNDILNWSLVWYWDMETIMGWKLRDLSWNWSDWDMLSWVIVWNGKIWNWWIFNALWYVEVPNTQALNMTWNLTLSAWIKTNSTKDYQQMINKESYVSSTDDAWYELLLHFWKPRFDLYNSNWTANFKYFTTTSTVNDGSWHLITATYDMSNLKIYIDARLDWQSAWSWSIRQGPIKLNIWRATNAVNQEFQWSIDDIRVYNRTLSDSEISTLYNTSK